MGQRLVWALGLVALLIVQIITLGSSPYPVFSETMNASIVSYSIDSGEFEEGDRVDARIEVKNTGNVDHRFYVGYSVRGPNGNWYDAPYDDLSIDAGDTRSITLSWRVPDNPPGGSYSARVAVYEDESGSSLQNRLDYREKSNAFSIKIPVINAQIISFSIDSGEFEEGDRVDARIEVKNTGNVDHRFYVGYSVRDPNGNWYDAPYDDLNIDAGGTSSITLRWNVPDNPPGGSYSARVAVYEDESGGSLQNRFDYEEKSNAFSIGIQTISAEIVSYTIDSKQFEVGDTVNADIKVKNTGNVDHRFYVGYSVRDPNGNWYDAPYDDLNIDAGGTSSITLRWNVPKGVPEGSYLARVAVYEDESGGSLQTRFDYEEKPNAFTVGIIERVISAEIVSYNIVSGEFEEGDRVDARIEVKNTGNVDHRFYVGYSVRDPNGSWLDAPYDDLSIDAGDTRSITLSWRVPDGASSGSYLARVAVYEDESGGALQNRFDYKEKSGAFTVRIQTINAQIVFHMIDSMEFEVGDSVAAEISIKNTGNVDHRFYVGYSVRGPNGNWFDAPYNALSIDAGDTSSITLRWKIPSNAPEGSYVARVAVYEDESGGALQNRLDLKDRSDAFRIGPSGVIRAEIISLSVDSGIFGKGDRVDVLAEVKNTGTVGHTFYIGYSVKDKNGNWWDAEFSDIYIDAGKTGRTTLGWEVLAGAPDGLYLARVAVYEDESGGALQNRLDLKDRSDAFRKVGEVDPPVITVDIEKTTYRPGELVRAKISTSGGDGGQVLVKLAGPFGTIDSRTFKAKIDYEYEFKLSDHAMSAPWWFIHVEYSGILNTIRFEVSPLIEINEEVKVTISADKDSMILGDEVTISGSVNHPGYRTINVVINGPGNVEIRKTADLNVDGSFSLDFAPWVAGQWSFQGALGANSDKGMKSEIAAVRVIDQIERYSLEIFSNKDEFVPSDMLTVFGRGIPDDMITIVVSNPFGYTVVTKSFKADRTGEFADFILTWPFSESMFVYGNYKIKAMAGKDVTLYSEITVLLKKPPLEIKNFTMEESRQQCCSMVKGAILKNTVDVEIDSVGYNTIDISAELINIRNEHFVIDVYSGHGYEEFYVKSIDVGPRTSVNINQNLVKSDRYWLTLDVNIDVGLILLEYILDNSIGGSPSMESLQEVREMIKKEYFPNRPMLSIGYTEWVKATASFMKENPSIFVDLATEAGVEIAINIVIEIADKLLAGVLTAASAIEAIVKAATIPAEERIWISINESSQTS